MSEIKISIVSYFNSRPFIYGLEHSTIPGNIHIELDTPAVCAEKLLKGKVDIGLVPVAIIPQLKKHQIISNYCIGANGPVSSVMLYSDVPLHQVTHILLDYQSRTSVMLARVLAKDLWKIDPVWVAAKEGYEKEIQGTTAAVIIGDRTFGLDELYSYTYDLSEEWTKLTGLPFVFACWVTNKPLPSEVTEAFDKAMKYGVDHIPQVIQKLQKQPGTPGNIGQYLTQRISYPFDEVKKQALALFLKKAAELGTDSKLSGTVTNGKEQPART